MLQGDDLPEEVTNDGMEIAVRPGKARPAVGSSCSSMPFFGGGSLFTDRAETPTDVNATSSVLNGLQDDSAALSTEEGSSSDDSSESPSSLDKSSPGKRQPGLGGAESPALSSTPVSGTSLSARDTDDDHVPSAVAAALAVIEDDDDDVVGESEDLVSSASMEQRVAPSLLMSFDVGGMSGLTSSGLSGRLFTEAYDATSVEPEASSEKEDERAGTPYRLEKEELIALGFDLSTTTALEQAIALQLVSSKDPLLLSYLAALPDLRELAIKEGKELRKPFFVDRPHLFRCVQEDKYTTRISLAPASAREEHEKENQQSSQASPLPRSIPADEGSLSSSPSTDSVGVKDLVDQRPKSSRQVALEQLEQDILSYIRSSDQQSVFLGRFGSIAALRRLAQKAGVELKKPFFAERPQLFCCIQDVSGTIRVVSAEDEHARQSEKAKDDQPPGLVGDDQGSADDLSVEDDVGGVSDLKKKPRTRDVADALEEMENAALVFAYQSAGKAKILLALFGQNRHLKKLAVCADTPWRKPFFTERSHLFSCCMQGVTALSVQLTDAGYQRAAQLVKSGFSVPLNLVEETTAEDVAATALEQLDRAVVAYLMAQPEHTTFLHNIAVEPGLQRLAKMAGEVLRKPYYESRPHLFRVQYIQTTTAVVRLVKNAVQNLQASHNVPESDKVTTRSSASNPVQLLENELAEFILASSEQPLYLSRLAQDLRLQEMAQNAGVRLGKAFFQERPHLFIVNQLGTHSAKLTVRLNQGRVPSGKPTGMATALLPSGPGIRRLENAAVSLVIQAGQPIPVQRLCHDSMLLTLAKQHAELNVEFFRLRPHLFHCQAEGGTTTVSPPLCSGHLKELEEAVERTLQNYNDHQAELGILGNDKHLAAIAARVAPGVQITKAFFLARPHRFHLIQRGSRAEVALVKKKRHSASERLSLELSSPVIGNGHAPSMQRSKVRPGSMHEMWRGGSSQRPPTIHDRKESGPENGMRWEDVFNKAMQTTESPEDHMDKDSPTWPSFGAMQPAETSLSPSSVRSTWPSMKTPVVDNSPVSNGRSSLRQWQQPNEHTTADFGSVVTRGTEIGFGASYQPTAQSSFSSAPTEQRSADVWTRLNGDPAVGSNGWPDYRWGSGLPLRSQPEPTFRPPAPSTVNHSSARSMPELSDEQLDFAERLLLTSVPSLAYSLRLLRLGELGSMLSSLQLDRLRAELLQLQLARGQPVLVVEETHLGASPNNDDHYEIAIVMGDECFGKGRGAWKEAKVKAMVLAAARLSLHWHGFCVREFPPKSAGFFAPRRFPASH